MKTITIYKHAFWNAIRGKQSIIAEMKESSYNSGGYILPSDFNDKYLKASFFNLIFRVI